MASDSAVKSRLVIQFDQVSSLETTHPQEVRCVQELITDGIVVGTVCSNSTGEVKAKIERLTKFGQQVLENLRKHGKNDVAGSPTAGFFEKVQIDNDRVFDEALLKLSSAGLGVLLGLLPLFDKLINRIGIWMYCCYCVAAASCGICAVILLVSHKTSSAAFSRLSTGNRDGAKKLSGLTEFLNWSAFGSFVIAALGISVFVCFVSYKVMKVGG